MPAALDPDLNLFALIAEENQLCERAASAQDAGNETAAAYLHERANFLDAMICASHASTIAGVIALLEYDNPDADGAAIASLREIDARLKARGWTG